jgi:hypothetical protein
MKEIVANNHDIVKKILADAASKSGNISNNNNTKRPGYVDEAQLSAVTQQQQLMQEMQELKKQADTLFEKHDWLGALPLFTKLAQNLPNDFGVQLKAAVVLTVCVTNIFQTRHR